MQKTAPEESSSLFLSASPSTITSKVAPDPAGNTMASKQDGAATTGGTPALRHVNLNTAHNNPQCSNVVRTSTYSAWNFVPLFLFFQFRRPANMYFIIICVLQVRSFFF